MKHYLNPLFALAGLIFVTANPVYAETQMVIALKTDQFELTETDISTLAVGEAKTIETDSGSVIDILRTSEGAEVYVDGELLELDLDHEGTHGKHMTKRHVEVICEDEDACEEQVITIVDEDDDIVHWEHDEDMNVSIHKEIEISCNEAQEDIDCKDKLVWVSRGDDIDVEKLHEMHEGEEGHKVIVIKKQVRKQDPANQ